MFRFPLLIALIMTGLTPTATAEDCFVDCIEQVINDNVGGPQVRTWTTGWEGRYGCFGLAVVDESGMSGILELQDCNSGWFTGYIYDENSSGTGDR